MDVAVDLVTGIWVGVVATAGVGAAEFTGAVGVVAVGTGWARTHLVPSFGYHSPLPFVRDIHLGSWGFSNHGVGAWLGWSWQGLLWLGFGLGPGLLTKFPFQLQICSYLLDEGGVRMEPCAPGITLDYLGCPVPSEHVNALHCLHFNFHIYCFYR